MLDAYQEIYIINNILKNVTFFLSSSSKLPIHLQSIPTVRNFSSRMISFTYSAEHWISTSAKYLEGYLFNTLGMMYSKSMSLNLKLVVLMLLLVSRIFFHPPKFVLQYSMKLAMNSIEMKVL